MAQRRMFSKKITDTDLFLDMPLSAQCLYFHLNMEADDDGFLGNAKTIRRKIGSSEDDLKLLMAKEFIFPFESGVVVIKDWKIHNYIRKDTYNETMYLGEKEELEEKNGMYTLRQRDVDGSSPQVRLGKVRLGKVNKDTMSSSSEHDCMLSDNQIVSSSKNDKKESKAELSKRIINYLNNKASTKYRYQTKSTQQKINARISEGYSEQDFYTVIDKKVTEWSNNPEMQKFIRPETLFGTKFESYLNQPIITSYKKSYQKPTVRKESLPEWTENEVKEEKPMSEEEQNYFKERIQSLKMQK
ncbi:conserved phage C-terminal domain-containing protein [Vagococcus entomophilus]|uniref:Phage conserved hypothetical protein C-terminal domain-containing protein n=1 Tax=Vagococcus entomophilus TaxID=1160095 RepID=A0A430AKC9_9ENTE|nr:conserved phage C-terminal domain-containing protein [Vagococcus entomophilus]RSU08463.1 hypothetical protein CBF30_04280 [Vagococcus entomophilus]